MPTPTGKGKISIEKVAKYDLTRNEPTAGDPRIKRAKRTSSGAKKGA